MSRILVADDDKTLNRTLIEWFKVQPFVRHVDSVLTGDDAWHYLSESEYDLVVLDWEMPGMQGIEIVRKFRAKGGVTPILMLTGKDSIEDKETGLDAGADDYLTKPFNLRELAARLRALLRRPAQVVGETLTFRHIRLDRTRREVTTGETVIPLQPMEFIVLEFSHYRGFAGETLG
jgi:DNA-binding response OmpR family regulator